jgi:hypothetical protein
LFVRQISCHFSLVVKYCFDVTVLLAMSVSGAVHYFVFL